jgi:hypothetical protein
MIKVVLSNSFVGTSRSVFDRDIYSEAKLRPQASYGWGVKLAAGNNNRFGINENTADARSHDLPYDTNQ